MHACTHAQKQTPIAHVNARDTRASGAASIRNACGDAHVSRAVGAHAHVLLARNSHGPVTNRLRPSSGPRPRGWGALI